MGGWFTRVRNFFKEAEKAPDSPMPAAHQQAATDGSGNIIIQIQGDGNTIVPQFAHLTLTRYLLRRTQNTSEADLLSPYGMTIPFIGREMQLAELWSWM